MADDQQTDDVILERPDEHQETGDELYCWMPGNSDRECEGSCVAYEPRYEDDQRLSSCSVLNAIRSSALSSGIQANLAKQYAKAREIKARQEQAGSLPDPPEVR